MSKEQLGVAECANCLKKQEMIQKYVSLIDLLKKKNDKSNHSISLKQSIDGGTTGTTSFHSKSPKTAFLFKLCQLERRHKLEALRRMQQRAVQNKCHKGFRLAQALERCIMRRLQEGIRLFWIVKNQSSFALGRMIMDQQKSLSSLRLDSSYPRNTSCVFSSMSLHGNDKICSLSRKLFTLSREVEGLRWSNKLLEEQIQQNNRRQEIESKKKKESLEMLAEQMGQKNDMIAELQTALRFYESRQGRVGNNILDEDGIALRLEIQNLQKVNQKLGVQLQKRCEQLAKVQEQFKQASDKLQGLKSENASLKQKNFEMGVQLQGFQKKRKEYYNLSSFVEKKLANLKKYEKVISTNLKAIEQHSCYDRSSFNVSTRIRSNAPEQLQADPLDDRQEQPSFCPISQFQAQYKIEKILNYVFNIELEDVWINNDEKLFDHEELEVLNSVKTKFIELNQQIKQLKLKKQDEKRLQSIEPKVQMTKRGSKDEVYCNQQQLSSSIFQVLATERPKSKQRLSEPAVSQFEGNLCAKCGQSRHNGDNTTRRDNQNFTIKLLQLQIEKSKQIQKISELKNKLMHIRSVVMNFIKSLQLRNLKQQSRDIAEVFFELFQYSEQEKEIIMHQGRRERRFLGLF